MIPAIQSPMTMGGPMQAFQVGQQLGAGNNPLTSLGRAIKGTVDTFKATRAAQAEQANAMALQGSKNENALAVQGLQNQAAAGNKPTAEQLAELGQDPEITYDADTGAAIIINKEWDSKAGAIQRKGSGISAPDQVKAQTAAMMKDYMKRKQRGGQGPAPIQVETPNVIQQSAGQAAGGDDELVARIEAMAQKFRQAQTPSAR